MDFSFSEEQTLLRNSVQGFLAGAYDFEARRKTIKSELGYRPEIWKKFAELGLLALPFEEKYGGLGKNAAVETMIVMEEFGRALVVEPYLASVVLAGGLLRQAANPQQKDALIPPLAKGEAVWAFGFAEPNSRFDLAWVETTAKKSGGNYVISGQKAAVAAAPWADKLLFTARSSGKPGEPEGLSLFAADAKAKGIEMRDYPSVDGGRAAEVVLDGLELPPEALIGPEGGALPLVQQAADHTIAALCAEAVGCIKALNSATTEYCKTRKQFGVPISSFQVLQHRMVDMFIAGEEAVSMTYMLTLQLGTEERAKAAAAAKAKIGQAGRFVGQQAVQLHGGMGTTEELNVGHHLKRLTVIDAMFGNTDYHLRRYGAL